MTLIPVVQTLKQETEQIPAEVVDLIGGGGGTRTSDLRIMSGWVQRRLQSYPFNRMRRN